MSDFGFLDDDAAKDHAIVAPILKELHELEGKTFITDNLQLPTESYIATFQIGIRSFTAWKKSGADPPCKFLDFRNNTVLRVTRSYLIFIARLP